ncbi:MAG: DMT family transporter [Alphaproteobacteria bacterium]|nr:DMT family transporter [Alphaproteobacteria bacterium]
MTDMSTVMPTAGVKSGFSEKWRDPAIRGAIFKVCSCLSFSGINGLVRYFTLSAKEAGLTPIPATELAFFETIFGLIFILPWILSTGRGAFKTNNSVAMNMGRALAASLGIILWFTALSKMPIVQVVAFKYAAPLFTILGAKLFLGEKCGWARAAAIGTALAGAFLITGHEILYGEADWTAVGLLALFPMAASACYVASALLAKTQLKKDTPQTVCLYLFLLSLPILGLAASFDWVTPLAWQWPYLIVMGALLTTAYVFLQHAYVIADITYLVPMSFTRLIAGAAIGMIFFNEWPIIWTWVGSFFILIATVSLCKNEVQTMKKNDLSKSAPLPTAA